MSKNKMKKFLADPTVENYNAMYAGWDFSWSQTAKDSQPQSGAAKALLGTMRLDNPEAYEFLDAIR